MICLSTAEDCGAASVCSRHAALALEAAGGDAVAASAPIAALAEGLRALRAGSARSELVACGALLAERFRVDLSEDPAALRIDAVLARSAGAPLALGAIAVTAARDAGIALGLLIGPRGRLLVAHAMLARPLVLELQDGFALRDITGDEQLFRWLCAHETARRVRRLLGPARPRDGRAATVALAGRS